MKICNFLPHTKDLDLRVSELLEHMWLDDEPLTYAGRLMSGLKRFVPQLRWRLPQAKQYFSNWQSIHVTGQAARFPPAVIMAYAGLAVATKQYSLAASGLFSVSPHRRNCFTHCIKGCSACSIGPNPGRAPQHKNFAAA